MHKSLFLLLLLGIPAAGAEVKPLRALLIAGGCCHDYATQKDLLKKGIEARARVEVDVLYSPDRSTRARFDIYEKPDWAKGYDVVIHDECSADVKEQPYVQNILNAHKGGVPAVNLHCAMHCYRTGTDDWFRFCGIQSTSHGPQKPIQIDFVDKEHPITKPLAGWTTGNEELYNNVKIFETATPLARGKQDTGKATNEYVVVWVNEYGQGRVFSTTLGHNNTLVGDPRYLDLVTRGLLWACDKLNEDYLKPAPAEDKPQANNNKDGKDPSADVPGSSAAAAAESRRRESELLKEIKVPEGFEATLFAAPPLANYPVFVAAAPDGTLYVSSDGNGSLGRDSHRGRVLRLRDHDGDGRADEVTEFVRDVDSPRGLVWDRDRLYLLHPPHISAYIDRDGDGVADEEKLLVKDIAFTFKDRPADHTSNGLGLGVDGWLYAAIGDFGFMEAEGTDGRKLQLRGGGVVRVRPDGTGLELFASGTRNILEVALGPLLDGFARDNTNDGDGWDVRFHHFTGLEEHGYPTLYKNFSEEIVKPLADYGGGSGCGAAWIDEPGIPAKWNNAPFTADWGRGWIYCHPLVADGATFRVDQKEFVGVTRPTDLDVDAFGRIYVASWKGATFNWAGPDVGYIIRLTPKGFSRDPLSDFGAARERALIQMLEWPSHRRRLAAQRELLQRPRGDGELRELEQLAGDRNKALSSRVAALFLLKQKWGVESHSALAKLAADSSIAAWAIRALTDRADQLEGVPVAPILKALTADDARIRNEAVIGLARLGKTDHASALVPLLADSDPVVAHTTVEALSRLRASETCLAVLDRSEAGSAVRAGAFRVLQRLHEPGVAGELLRRLETEREPARRHGLLIALCRLHSTEGKWKGNSWGTRPDTRGPYYQPEDWSETPPIAAALRIALEKADAAEAVFLSLQLLRHRVLSGEAVAKMIELHKEGALPDALLAKRLADMDSIPVQAVAILGKIAGAGEAAEEARRNAFVALTKADSPGAIQAALMVLPSLLETGKNRRLAETFFSARLTEKHYDVLVERADNATDESAVWADATLLKRAGKAKDRRRKAAAAAREALEAGWEDPARRARIIEAMILARDDSMAEKLRGAANDGDPRVAEAAKRAAKALKIDLAEKGPSGRLVSDLSVGEAVASALNAKGERSRGEQLFVQQGCAACHTVTAGEPLKGPFLGNIANTYPRREIAEAILIPSKSVAQGFAAYRFELRDGEEVEGFVIEEAADAVTIRNIASQEMKLAAADIVKRDKLEKSLMPDGLAATLTVEELASLLDYLESLGTK